MIESQVWLFKELEPLDQFAVLELGTHRWKKEKPTHKKALFPKASKYVMTDFLAGDDVDVVADAHELSRVFGEASFDLVIAHSVFEHLERPWIAAEEILNILKPGGLFWIQTHQSFPVHGFPSDYFRYTTEGLKVLFARASEKYADYEFPAMIVSKECGSQVNNCWINVCIAGRK